MHRPNDPYYCNFCKYRTFDPLNFGRHMTSRKHYINEQTGGIYSNLTAGQAVRTLAQDPKRSHHKKPENEIKLGDDDGEIFLTPFTDKSQTNSLFVAGPRGCGKSRYCADYIKDYKDYYPKNKIYLFSNKDKDDPLDDLKPIRIKLSKSLIDDPYSLKDFKNSLVLFDDIDGISDKDIKKEVFRLYDTILKDGRSLNITPIITYHNITDYKNTREMLNNSSHCVIFPKSGAIAQTTYMLKNYCGLNNKQVRKIMKLDSRSVAIQKTAPMAVISSKCIYLL